jgi:hypothetical protein
LQQANALIQRGLHAKLRIGNEKRPCRRDSGFRGIAFRLWSGGGSAGARIRSALTGINGWVKTHPCQPALIFGRCAGVETPLSHRKDTGFRAKLAERIPQGLNRLRKKTWTRAFSIHMLPFEDRARWLFLEEKATRHHGFCMHQSRRRCNLLLSNELTLIFCLAMAIAPCSRHKGLIPSNNTWPSGDL